MLKGFHVIKKKKVWMKNWPLEIGLSTVCPVLNFFPQTYPRTFVEDRCFFLPSIPSGLGSIKYPSAQVFQLLLRNVATMRQHFPAVLFFFFFFCCSRLDFCCLFSVNRNLVQLYTDYLFFFRVFSHIGYYSVSSRRPCANSRSFGIFYLIISSVCVC